MPVVSQQVNEIKLIDRDGVQEAHNVTARHWENILEEASGFTCSVLLPFS